MSRVFRVWNSTSKETKQITKFYVTDITDEEHKNGVNRPEIAIFPVSNISDESRQQKRADDYCDYVNGYHRLALTEKGEEYNRRLAQRRELEAERKRQEAAEQDIVNQARADKTYRETMSKLQVSAQQNGTVQNHEKPQEKSGWLRRFAG